MVDKFTCLVFLSVLLASAVSFDCSSIALPVFGKDGYCATWDLSGMASLPSANITAGSYLYYLQVCNNVKDVFCKEPSPAYQLFGSSCYTLGKLSDVIIVSLRVKHQLPQLIYQYNITVLLLLL